MPPLSIKLNTSAAKTAIPLIAEGTMTRFRVQHLELIDAEGDRKFPMLKIEVRLLDPAPTSDGGQVQPGFPVFTNIMLGSKEDPSTVPQWAQDRLAKIQDSCLGTADADNKKGKPARPDFLIPESFPEYIGKEFVAKVKVNNKNPEFVSNELTNFTFPADIAA